MGAKNILKLKDVKRAVKQHYRIQKLKFGILQ